LAQSANLGSFRERNVIEISAEVLLEAYPQLSRADLQAAWENAARSATEEVVFAQD
jgi:hypothetical protein